ncbi:TPA: Ig-like domain-containing protein [Staphylococcus aureus]
MKNNLRYGIRKHKLGAASVFLGTMIVVGMGQDKEAAASEQKTTTVEENGNSATENKVNETQTTTTNVNTIDETQSYSATATEQPSNATQVTTEEAPKAVQAPQTAQPANLETVKEEVVKEEAKPQVKETTQSQDNSGDQRQVDLTPKKATQNQVAETQVEVAQPRTASESKPRVTRSADVVEAKEASDEKVETGTDVTSKVTVESGSIEAPQGNKVEPHAGQRVVLKYKLKFADGLKRGDYFDFTLSNNVNTYGVSTARKVPEIKNGSVVMATGEILGNGNIRYTFTNEIEHKVEVTANLEINLFIDPKTVQSNGEQKITSKLNGEETEKTIPVVYNPGVSNSYTNVNGSIETFNKESNKFTHIAYIKPIDFEYHTAVEGVEGHAEGIIETEEDSIHVDFEESTHENSKHHADVVEYEEDTNPGGGQVITESNLVEFDEESTKGILTGAVSDHTTVEDTKEYTTESNLIELVDELPEEHGQAQGPIEEITENNHHISHSGLGTENGHGNYGVIEEIEENSHVDIKSELGYEGGQNSGNQSFEEDTEEDKPKYEQGGNIVDIDFDSVPQIHGQNKGDQSFEEDTEKDKPKYEHGGNIIDIDFDSVPHIHGFNKHTEIIEEDTNKDKPNYQFGGHNSVDFEEDTLPQVSGHNEGQQTIEEDTTPPTPPTPEVPSEPETPTPPTPEVPSEPETPTPPTPEVPSEPETPTPPTPEVPAEPGKPVPPAKEEPKKPSKPVEQGKVVTPVIEINEKVKAVAPTKKAQSKKSELPETGGEESTNKGILFGGLFSILGFALLRRNKKNHKA